MIAVASATAAEKDWIRKLLDERWDGPEIVSRGQWADASELPALIATSDGEPVGLLTYRLHWSDLEVVTLDSLREGQGVATALLDAVREIAGEEGCKHIWLATTNDNLQAMGFYQRRGYRFAEVRQGALTKAREKKSSIPKIGQNKIPVRDEIELRLDLEK